MDLGIAGRTALVCGASKGLGYGCAEALVHEGVNVVIVARGAEALGAAAQRLQKVAAGAAGPFVKPVAADITTVEGRAAAFAAHADYAWSPMPAARRRATSATGTATPGSRRSTPTC